MPLLIVQTRSGEISYPLEGAPLTIGRSPANVIQLMDPAASRKHCMLKRSGGDSIVVDMGSANGTKVNNARIEREQILKGGDEILVGQTLIRYIEDTI